MSIEQFDGLWLLGFCTALILSFGLGALKGGQQ